MGVENAVLPQSLLQPGSAPGWKKGGCKGSPTYPGPGSKDRLGPPTAVPQLHQLDWVFLVASQNWRVYSTHSVGEAGLTSRSGYFPKDSVTRNTSWPGSSSPFTRFNLCRREGRPICNTQASQTRTLTERSQTPPDWVPIGCTPRGPRLRPTRAHQRRPGGVEARRRPICWRRSWAVSRSFSEPMGIPSVERPASLLVAQLFLPVGVWLPFCVWLRLGFFVFKANPL